MFLAVPPRTSINHTGICTRIFLYYDSFARPRPPPPLPPPPPPPPCNIFFSMSGCGHCKKLAPALSEAATKIKDVDEKLVFAKVSPGSSHVRTECRYVPSVWCFTTRPRVEKIRAFHGSISRVGSGLEVFNFSRGRRGSGDFQTSAGSGRVWRFSNSRGSGRVGSGHF